MIKLKLSALLVSVFYQPYKLTVTLKVCSFERSKDVMIHSVLCHSDVGVNYVTPGFASANGILSSISKILLEALSLP